MSKRSPQFFYIFRHLFYFMSIFLYIKHVNPPNYFPQHFLYFLPLPQGHSSFLPISSSFFTGFFPCPSSTFEDILSTSTTCFLCIGSSIVKLYKYLTVSSCIAFVMLSNISKPSNLYATTGSC